MSSPKGGWGRWVVGGKLPTQFRFNVNGEGAGLGDYGVRWCDTALGRFVQPDPVVQDPFDPHGLSLYGYVRNDPGNRIDPDRVRLRRGLRFNRSAVVAAISPACW